MSARNVAVLILYRTDAKILLQHRTNDAPTYPDHWAFFGGGIEDGETAKEAVAREALEELGYELTSPRLFTIQQFIHQGTEHAKHVFVEKYDGAILTLGEGQAMGWFTADETDDLKMNDHDRSIIQSLRNMVGRVGLEPTTKGL